MMKNLFYMTKKLQQCNEYINQLEKQNQLLHDNMEAAAAQKEGDELSRYRQRKRALLRPIKEMADFVGREFEFRHNVVRDSYEYRRRKADGETADTTTATQGSDEWLPVDERQMNTIMNHVQDDGEVFCLKSLVQHRPSLLRSVSETSFGTMLCRIGIPREHHHDGNLYRVVHR